MTTIIRIEHPSDGKGLWQSLNTEYTFKAISFTFIDDLIQKHREFPTPCNDILINRFANIDEYCAFLSIEQIQQWIEPQWFKEIKEFGFKILMIDVSECIKGEYQILYKKEHILQTKDISNLF